MTTSELYTSAARNHLLATLPDLELQRVVPHLQQVTLPFKQVLYRVHGPMDYVYFPLSGIVSAMAIMQDGTAIEVATIGNEGMAGVMVLLGVTESTNEIM